MKNWFLLPIVVAVLGSTAIGQQNLNAPISTIGTVGTAEVLVVPDIATVTLTVKKTNKELTAAKEEADANIVRIFAVAKQFGVGSTDIQTDYIAIKQEFEVTQRPGDSTVKTYFTGYSVSKTVVVRLRKINRFDDFLSEVVKAGVSKLGDVVFETSELRKYKDAARAQAIRAARDKAVAFAKEIGQTIGKAVTINESSVDSWNNPSSNISLVSFSDSSTDDDSPSAFSVGTISIKAQVSVRFILN